MTLHRVIRQAEPRDRAELEACFFELQAHERSVYSNRAEPASIVAAYIDYLLAECASKDGAILVAESDGRIVGFACVLSKVPVDNIYELHREYAHITDLVVLEAWRGRGIGEQLMQKAEEYASMRGATLLRIGVLAANERAHGLYRKMGFREYGILLEKTIGPDQA